MSSESACRHAKKAVSTYGPTVLRDAFKGKERLEKAGATLIIDALDAAADAATRPAVKRDIRNLASAYSRFRGLHDRLDVALDARILADTAHLDFACRS